MHRSHYKQLLDVPVLIAKRAGLSDLFKAVASELMSGDDRRSWRYLCKVMEVVGTAVDSKATASAFADSSAVVWSEELLHENDQLFTSPPF